MSSRGTSVRCEPSNSSLNNLRTQRNNLWNYNKYGKNKHFKNYRDVIKDKDDCLFKIHLY